MATSTSGLRKKDEKITISNQELLKALEGCGKWHFQMGSFLITEIPSYTEQAN